MENRKVLKIVIAVTLISITLVHIDDINIFFGSSQKAEESTNEQDVIPFDYNKTIVDNNPQDQNIDETDTPEIQEIDDDVYLYDLDPIDGEFDISQDCIKDVYDNEYDECFYVFLADTLGFEEVSAEYSVNGKYSLFTGTLFTDRDDGINSVYKMEVYVDEKRIYTSPKMKLKTKPEKFEIPISGANFIKIVFYFKDGNNGGPVDGFICSTHGCLYDAKLIK